MRIDTKLAKTVDDRPKIKSMHGEVKTYRMSEAELIQMRKKTVHPSGLTREEVIRSVAAGESLLQIEKRKGMKQSEIYHWVKKWGIHGIYKDTAIELMIIENMTEIVKESKNTEDKPMPVETVKNEIVDKKADAESEIVAHKNQEELIESAQQIKKSVAKLPMKIANGLELARHNGYGDNEILIITAQSAWQTMTADKVIHQLNGYADLMSLSIALRDGYEVQKTTEEILEEAFNLDYLVCDWMNRKQAFREGMKFTLKTLGYSFDWCH